MATKKEKEYTPDGQKTLILLTAKEAVWWFFFFVITSGGFFALGVFVGRDTTPHFDIDKLQKELSLLKETVIKKEQDRLTYNSNEKTGSPELEFHEALKRPENKEISLKRKRVPEKNRSRIRAMTLAKGDREETPAKIDSSKTEAQKTEHKGTEDGETEKAETDATFTIQVAALKDRDIADQMVVDLAEKGFKAHMVVWEPKENQVWYRIRVGSFSNREDASETMKKLTEDNKKPVLIKK